VRLLTEEEVVFLSGLLSKSNRLSIEESSIGSFLDFCCLDS
jgi:hypothetical protein